MSSVRSLHFLVVDSHFRTVLARDHCIEATHHVIASLREYANLLGAMAPNDRQETADSSFAVIHIHNSLEIVMKPSRFSLITFHSAMDAIQNRLTSSTATQNEKAASLLSQAVDIVARYVQKLSHKRELQIRVTCIVMAIPSEYQNVISYLQVMKSAARVNLEFLLYDAEMSPRTVVEELNHSLRSCYCLLREIKFENGLMELRRHTRQWLHSSPHMAQSASLCLSDPRHAPIVVLVRTVQLVVKSLNTKAVRVCPCHNKPVIQSGYCSTSQEPIGNSYGKFVPSFGSVVLESQLPPDSTSELQHLQCLGKLPMKHLDASLFMSECKSVVVDNSIPWEDMVTNRRRFNSLRRMAEEGGCALLLRSTESAQQYCAWVPSHTTASFLQVDLAIGDQLIPSPAEIINDDVEGVDDEFQRCLDALKTASFDPWEHDGKFHLELNALIQKCGSRN